MTAIDIMQGPRGAMARLLDSGSEPLCLTLALVVLWALMHHYQGFARDGELYAMQAFARLHPTLTADVYLAHGSQDRFTVFSPMYAAFIAAFGLQPGELILFLACTVWFMASAWVLARALVGGGLAWLAAALLAAIACYYGAYSIFRYSETYLTARSLSEALVVTALAVHFCGRPRIALAIAAAALLIHPLMALPGLLLLAGLNVHIRTALFAALLGVAAALALALVATRLQATSGVFTVIDAQWLEVVRERSQFLFLNYWSWSDWQMHARPFLCLTLSALVLDDARIKKLCLCSMLVGAAGLAVAGIAGSIGPMALLLQGQPWRWFWITGFVSVLLLAPTAAALWRDLRCGRFCAVLLIAAWTFTPLPVSPALMLALALWCLRDRIQAPTGRILRYAAYAVIAIAVAWTLANAWSLFNSPRAESSEESLLLDRVRSVFDLQVSAVVIFWCLWSGIRSARSAPLTLGISAALLAMACVVLPTALNRGEQQPGSPRQVAEFAQWRAAIPPESTVLVVPTRKSAAFIWFTLERPSYLSVDQSSGVVFSRATAAEVRRRSDVLLPIMEPDWNILSQINREAQGEKLDDLTRPLTEARLASICGDLQLGFVVAQESFPFEPLRHTHTGAWKDWNLYDCRVVRSKRPGA